MEIELFECTVCGKVFPDKKRLIRHMAGHEPSRAFKCTKCSKTFTVEANLKSHMRVHNDKFRRRHIVNDTPEEIDHLLITGCLSQVKTDTI